MSAKAKSKLTPEQQKATMTRVLQKIKPYGFFVVCSLIVAAVSVAAQLYIPILCGNAIDMMLGKGSVDFAGVLPIIYEIIVVAVVAAFAQWLLSVCNNRITFAVSRDLRNAAMRKIQTLPLSYLDSHPSGDIVSRMVADVDTFADGLLMGFTQLFSGVLTILGTLLFMLQQNVPITLVVVCITPLSLVVASFLAKRSYKYFQSQSTVRGEQTALVNEMIEGQKVVQAFGHEAQSLEAFDEVNGRLQDVSLKAIFFSSMTNPATRFVNNIVYAGVGLVGAIYAVAGGITIGQLSIFLNYANQYTKPFNENFRRRDRAAERSGLRSPRVRAAGRRRPDPRDGERRKARAGRPRPDRGRLFPLSARPPAHRGPVSGRQARPAHRHRRPHRLRQDHPHQPAHAVL